MQKFLNSASDIIIHLEQNKNLTKGNSKDSQNLFFLISDWLRSLSSVKTMEKLLFFDTLGNMIQAGMPLNKGLQMIARQTRNKKFAGVIIDLFTLIESGGGLANGMRQNPDVFDDAVCSVVEAGEKSGNLSEVLRQIKSHYERINALQSRVRSMMLYPIILLIMMVGIVVVMTIFVIPRLMELFRNPEALPMPTRALLWMSNLVQNHWTFLLLGIFGVYFLAKFIVSTRMGRYYYDQLLILMPVMGDIRRDMIINRTMRILGFLVSSGVPLLDALQLSAKISGNAVYQEKFLMAASDLTKGISLSQYMADTERYFPEILVGLISVGEQTGAIDKAFTRTGEYFDARTEQKLTRLSKLLEPAILLILTALAVFLVLAIYMPILQVNEQIMV